MNPLTQMIQNTKAGTSKTLPKDKIEETIIDLEEKPFEPSGPTQEDLNKFLSQLYRAKASAVNFAPAEIEVPRNIVEFYNKHNIQGFDDVGYFVYEGVKVYELGKMAEAKKRDSLTMEQKNFGGLK